jgi:putative transposase
MPTVAIIDIQSIRTAEGGVERGHDSVKKNTGRKRHVAVDTLELLLSVGTTDFSSSSDTKSSAEC